MKDERYAVAYNDKNGNGFTETAPWIFDDFDDINQSKIKANELIKSGFKNVTVFKICDQPTECITWSYVKKYEINFPLEIVGDKNVYIL